MRMIFVFVLILNVLFAIWQYFRPQHVELGIDALPGHLTSIRLMRELPIDEVVESAAVNIGSDLESGRSFCHTLGPFTDSQMTEELKQRLHELTDKLAVRVIEENELYRYAVYVPAKNHEDAVVISKMLALQDVTDYLVMKKDGKKRVSLGHFKEKAYADKRAQQIAELGFKPEIEVVFRQYRLYWLDYELTEAKKSSVDALISPYLQNDISLLNRDCEI